MRLSTTRLLTAGVTLFLTTTATPAFAAAPAAANAPESQATSPADHTSSPQRALQRAVAHEDRAGAVGVTAAATKGRARWEAASGQRVLGGPVKAHATDRARAGSITKTMVATLAMQLVDDGCLRLDSRIGDIAPGLVPGHDDITLEQLLSHRSGLKDYLVPLAEQEREMGLTPEQSFARTHTDKSLIRLALTQKVDRPGSRFTYANTNYVIVGQLLQRRTGVPLGTLLRHRVFKPAGMTGSYYAQRMWVPRTFLTEHYVQQGKTVPFRQNATVFSAAGAVVSTPRDLQAFMRALMQGRLTSSKAVDQMVRPRSAQPAYGLGIYATPDPCRPKDPGARVYGHGGTTFGTLSALTSTRDGRRVASAQLTGRFLTPKPLPEHPSPDRVVAAAHKAMC